MTTDLDTLRAHRATVAGRIAQRDGELATLEESQRTAATDGRAPDRALSVQKSALRDEQAIDGQVLAGIDASIDQAVAEVRRVEDLAALAARVGALDVALGELDDQCALYPVTQDAFLAEIRAVANRLVHIRQEITRRARELHDERLAVRAEAARLGTAVTVSTDDPVKRLDAEYSIRDTHNRPNVRVFMMAGGRDAADVAGAAAVAAFAPIEKPGPDTASGVSTIPLEQQKREWELRNGLGAERREWELQQAAAQAAAQSRDQWLDRIRGH
jgi:hypothetical protein